MIIEGPVLDLIDVEVRSVIGGFVIGQSLLGVDSLGPDDGSEFLWTSYLGVATEVEVERGGSRSGVTSSVDVGTLDITLYNAGDPTVDVNVLPNVPIRMRSKADSEPFITATILDVDMDEEFDTKRNRVNTFVTLSCVDAVAGHANTGVTGVVLSQGYQTWEERIRALAVLSTTPVVTPLGDAYPSTRLASNLEEGSLIDHFDLANNSVGAAWWVDAHNVTRFSTALPAVAVATFTDTRTAGHLEYVKRRRAYDTKDVYNDLSVSLVGVEYDEEGVPSASSDVVRYVNDSSFATWGPRGQGVEFNLYEGGAFAGSSTARAGELLAQYGEPGNVVRELTWNVQEAPEMASLLDVNAPIDVWALGVLYECRIIHLTHEITPMRWMLTLTLIGR